MEEAKEAQCQAEEDEKKREREEGQRQAIEAERRASDQNLNRTKCPQCGFYGEMTFPFWNVTGRIRCPRCSKKFLWYYYPPPEPEK